MYSVTIAFFISAVNGYILNHHWTFRTNTSRKHHFAFSKYVLLNILTFFMNISVLTFLVEAFGLWYILSEIIAIFAALSVNFLGSRYWAFKPDRPPA